MNFYAAQRCVRFFYGKRALLLYDNSYVWSRRIHVGVGLVTCGRGLTVPSGLQLSSLLKSIVSGPPQIRRVGCVVLPASRRAQQISDTCQSLDFLSVTTVRVGIALCGPARNIDLTTAADFRGCGMSNTHCLCTVEPSRELRYSRIVLLYRGPC